MKVREIARWFYQPIRVLDLLLFGRVARERYGLALPCKKTTEEAWMGEMGRHYTKDNIRTIGSMDADYKEKFGITRSALNLEFLYKIGSNMKILEVGCNVGIQLAYLKRKGFTNLYGIELQQYAVDIAKKLHEDIEFIQGTVLMLPFEDKEFDMVFTSGVLIHIPEKEIENALREIHRCSKRFIWGCESYAEKTTPVKFRGYSNLYWHRDYVGLYRQAFPELHLIRQKLIPPLNNNGATYTMFLFEKVNARLERMKAIYNTGKIPSITP